MKSKFAFSLPMEKPSNFFTLANRVTVPVIGFGTWKLKPGKEAYHAVLTALQSGYLHIDTASVYENEEDVGKAIIDSKIPREQIFLTTKIWNNALTYDDAKLEIEKSLKRLQVDYLDLCLIHWPNPVVIRDKKNAYINRNREVYRAMEEAYREGKIRALGISNFKPHHINALLQTATVIPHVNQIYCSPTDLQEDVIAFNDQYEILTAAYSPLGAGKVLEHPTLKHIAKQYNKSVAQIILNYLLHKGVVPLPRSTNEGRIKQNLDVFDFYLREKDVKALESIRGDFGSAPDPDISKW